MQWSSSQKPVEGNPLLELEQLSCPWGAASLLELKEAQDPCPGQQHPSLLLTSPPAPKSHPRPGSQVHFHTEIPVLASYFRLHCSSEKAPSLLVGFRMSLVFWLEISHMTTFALYHIYFALRCGSKSLQFVFITLDQSSAHFFSLNINNRNVFATFPLLALHPSTVEAHNLIVFCCLTPAIHVLQAFKTCCTLLYFWGDQLWGLVVRCVYQGPGRNGCPRFLRTLRPNRQIHWPQAVLFGSSLPE